MGGQALVSKEQIDVSGAFTLTDLRNLIFLKLNHRGIYVGVAMMIFSYFYNLPAISYSATGTNELRFFTIASAILLFYYLKNYGIVNRYIRTDKVFYSFWIFALFGTFSMIFTAISAILIAKYSWVFQSLLYLAHLWGFFLTAVFVAILIRDPKNLTRVVYFLLFLGILCFLVIILQNMGVIPYLWKDVYFRSYQGFLNGTLGPNKVVAGITSLLMLIFALGIVSEKRFKVNPILCYACIAFAGVALVMSGSRTAYVGLAVFVAYFFIRSTKSFLYNSIIIIMSLIAISAIEPVILEKAMEMYDNRVTNKISNEDDVKEGNVGSLYQDLGAGRGNIFDNYVELLANEYYYIPFGRGMNNRIDTFSSAHNMYLSVIYELGIIGLILYFRWLILYLFVKLNHFPKLSIALQGLIFSMLVTLFFGEHLYIYRPLFALLGLFLLVATLLAAPHYLIEKNEPEITR